LFVNYILFNLILISQYEGAYNSDGKGQSNWDNFTHGGNKKFNLQMLLTYIMLVGKVFSQTLSSVLAKPLKQRLKTC